MIGKSKVWALALLGGALIFGGAAGAAIDRYLVGQSLRAERETRRADRDRRQNYLDWLASELSLSDAQREQVALVAERHRAQMSEFWSEMRPRFEQLRTQARADIRAVLTPEQATAYDALLQRDEERHRRRRDGSDQR